MRTEVGTPRVRDIPGPYRFFFYSFDCNEPMHVHVRRDTNTCKFWLEPVELAANHGFSPRELNDIRRRVVTHHPGLVEAWHEHCG